MKSNANLLRGLHYFESVARHGSVKLAAEELGVTVSAVSRQMRTLTVALGEQLLVRAGRGIALTPTGRALAENLNAAFANLERSVLGVIGTARPVFRLAVCTSFGPGWLAPRIGSFLAAHPEIDLELRLYADHPGQTDQIADAIVTAEPVIQGFAAVPLFEERLVAVRAPAIAGQTDRLITTELDIQAGDDWRQFFAETGVDPGGAIERGFLRSTHFLMAMEMAKAGAGTALVPDFLAERDLTSGALLAVSPQRPPSGRTYRLCFKEGRAGEPPIAALAHWLKAEGAVSARRLALSALPA